MNDITFVDRYSATGTPRPTSDSCDYCEGMGVSPQQKSTLNKDAVIAKGGRLIVIGQHDGTDKKVPGEEDEWVFVKCPECCGSRKKQPADELEYGGYKWKRIN